LAHASSATLAWTGDSPLALPAIGAFQLRVLSPSVLELSLVTTKPPEPARPEQWDFVDANLQLHLPPPAEFCVSVSGPDGDDGTRRASHAISVQAVGFKRRVLYAPLRPRDLRIGNHLYLELASPVADDQLVEVKVPDALLWPAKARLATQPTTNSPPQRTAAADAQTDNQSPSTNHPSPIPTPFTARASSSRWSPAIHVNQVGYVPAWPKQALVGYYLGSLGEMSVPAEPGFKLIEAGSGKEVFQGRLVRRPDRGFNFPTYQKVLEADFGEFKTRGEYRLAVPGLGASFPFFIDDGVAAALARTYALGLYHQRCGTSNTLPFTRFTHGACHTAPAEVPTMAFTNTQFFLAEATSDYTNNPRHTAPQLKDLNASLYPFVRQRNIDVSGGHHDAGDYSKYTLDSAAFIHYLVFAVDAFPGVGGLDNLGLPESGDGKSDLLQEAKWEADFLAKMQDDDGGFYFLVYPRNRKYEDNVLPDYGDPQIVWPKNTAATAAAVAVLAQTASSPLFKKQFPEAAELYLKKAKKGWDFLEHAITRYGKDGSYQKLTHYGDEFMHDDELAWAACEMFVATGENSFHQKLRAWLNPADPATRRWGWWRLYEGYGCAIRSYAFAAKSGKLKREQLDPRYLLRCEDEIIKSAEDQLHWAQDSAYGTSFPAPNKRFRTAAWYFSLDRAFDLAAAYHLDHPVLNDPRPKFLAAILSNLNYEAGCNPVNVCYITGLGWKRQRETVHHYAMNDRRVLPPSGLPLGNVQAGFGWLQLYKQELGALTFPPDGAPEAPYPFYDRWGDSFNVNTEFVIVNQARALATLAFLMARTSLKDQPWRCATAAIELRAAPRAQLSTLTSQPALTATVKAPGLALDQARIVWEAQGQQPVFGSSFTFTPTNSQPWIETEAQWPDGRRVFAVTNSIVAGAVKRGKP
jgi:hypothetical protein